MVGGTMDENTMNFKDFPGWVQSHVIDLNGAFHAVGLEGKLYVVGGTVRDAIIGRDPRDGDYATSLDFRSMLAALNADDRFELATSNSVLMTMSLIHLPSKTPVDLAVLRAERYGDESIYPIEVTTPVPIEWDLARRDFTINAMAFDTEESLLIDPYDGVADVRDKLIRVLHDDSFKDDPKRIIRAIELATRLGFKIEAKTAKLAEDCVFSTSFDKLESAISKQHFLALIKENAQ